MRNITTCWTYGRCLLRSVSSAERGASVIEYAFLLALILVVCLAAIILIGNATNGSLSETGSSLVG